MIAAHAWTARLLSRYVPACQPQALSVWSCSRERVDLVCDWLGNQRLRNLLWTHWPELVPELGAGRRVALTDGTCALPVRAADGHLVGLMLWTGCWPSSAGARALLDELGQHLVPVLRDPLPAPEPDVLIVPLALINAPGGDTEAVRRIYVALLEAHGGSTTLASRTLGIPRQSLAGRIKRLGGQPIGLRLARVLYDPRHLEAEAFDLERRTCLEVLARCRRDVRLSAAALRLTVDAWRAYLEALGIDPPLRARRSPRRADG